MSGPVLDRVFVERAVSGSVPLGARPEGARLLAGLRAGDVVVVPKLDRMFRSALDALDVLGRLRRDGVALHMLDLGGDVTGGGVAKLVFSILSAVAEAERDRTIERIRDVKRDQKKRGRYLGGVVPFGFRLGEAGELVEHPRERDAIRRAAVLRTGGASLRKIAAALKADGHALSHVGVSKVLTAAAQGDRVTAA